MKIITAASYTATDLVSLDIVRAHVRALDDSEDALLTIYLEAAIDYLAQATNRQLGTVTTSVYVSRDEASEVISLSGFNNIQNLTVSEGDRSGTYTALTGSDYTASTVYPGTVDLTDHEPDSDRDEELYLISFTSGVSLSRAPKQYVQAALLLVGHYYNQREAEVIGQITSELKEGVRRLIMSARQF